jgi:metal-dependent amidase/aminoacylase/carboxypeptidase family protein
VAHAGKKVNVIPELGEISGTVRTLDEDMREATLREIEQTVARVCADRGMQCEIDFDAGCPPVAVDPDLYDLFERVGRNLLGKKRVERLERSSMGSEDFGHYLSHVPGLLFRLGMGLDSPELHNPRFDFNDEALESGITMLVGLALGVINDDDFLTG